MEELEEIKIVYKAMESRSYIIAAFSFKDGTIELDRVLLNFPPAQLENAINLLRCNLKDEIM